MVLPETVARWHRAGFRTYWAMLCKVRKRVGGGRRISKQIRELIFRMVAENPAWGAPRIHGELLMLGFEVSETTVSRWMRRAPRNPEPAQRWLAFLRNHREGIAAMDFFTVPTCSERGAFEANRLRLHLLLSRGPNPSRAAQANPGRQALCSCSRSGDLFATRRWIAPPLRSRCLS